MDLTNSVSMGAKPPILSDKPCKVSGTRSVNARSFLAYCPPTRIQFSGATSIKSKAPCGAAAKSAAISLRKPTPASAASAGQHATDIVGLTKLLTETSLVRRVANRRVY